jgi:hypothetical protein
MSKGQQAMAVAMMHPVGDELLDPERLLAGEVAAADELSAPSVLRPKNSSVIASKVSSARRTPASSQ